MQKVIIALAFLTVVPSCHKLPVLAEPETVNKELYTRVNIWYEAGKQDRIMSTNYHVGQILPAGTHVMVTEKVGDRIYFRDTEKGNTYCLRYARNHTVVPMSEYFDRMFGSSNVLEKEAFTEQELQAIRAGRVEPGMSKEAVLVAYGYPPAHKTPSLESNMWTYWTNRFNRRIVRFEGERVAEVRD